MIGTGHSPEHACLYCAETRVLISGDQILPKITPNISVWPQDPEADPLAMYLADIYTISANLAGICAVSVPCGFDESGLPIGYQLMGAAFQEETVLGIAHQYQLNTDFHRRLPPL